MSADGLGTYSSRVTSNVQPERVRGPEDIAGNEQSQTSASVTRFNLGDRLYHKQSRINQGVHCRGWPRRAACLHGEVSKGVSVGALLAMGLQVLARALVVLDS
jgi:hypothetical protein